MTKSGRRPDLLAASNGRPASIQALAVGAHHCDISEILLDVRDARFDITIMKRTDKKTTDKKSTTTKNLPVSTGLKAGGGLL